MSQWTHILGVIRFDSMGANCYPKPPEKDFILKTQASTVNAIFNSNLPAGSEGPLEINTFLTERGPTVLITGDLRDFGKEDLREVLEWVNDCVSKAHKKYKQIKSFHELYHLRDGIVYCEVEYDDTLYLIRKIKSDDLDTQRMFYLDEVQRPTDSKKTG